MVIDDVFLFFLRGEKAGKKENSRILFVFFCVCCFGCLGDGSYRDLGVVLISISRLE